jgi:sec-independent protein translocase protein TatB
MFEVGYSEILVIVVVLIIVVGPKELPQMLRTFSQALAKVRKVTNDFRRQFDDALKEAELGEMSKMIADVGRLDPRHKIREIFNPLEETLESVRTDVDRSVRPAISMLGNPAPGNIVSPEASKSESALAARPDAVAKKARKSGDADKLATLPKKPSKITG